MAGDESRRVAAGAGLISTARLIGGALNLLLVMILTRLLAKTDFAVVALFYLVQETIEAIGPMGLPQALSFFVPRLDPRFRRHLGWTCGIVLLALAIPFSAALCLAGPALALRSDVPAAASVMCLVALALLADFPGQVLPNFLIAQQSYRASYWVTLGFYGSRFLAFSVPAWLGCEVQMICVVAVAATGLRLAAFLIYFLLIVKGPLRRSAGESWRIRELFSYGVPLSLSQVVGKLNVQVDKYFILMFLAAEVFAVYTVGAVELPLVPGIAYSVTGALAPVLVAKYYGGQISEFIRLWHSSVIKVAAVMLPTFVFLMVFADSVVRLFFSAQYSEATIPFRVYLLLLPLRLCAYGAVVRCLGTTRPVLVSSALALVVNAVLTYPFFLLFGLAGPALAAVAAQFAAIAMLLAELKSRLGISWLRVFPYLQVARTAGIAAVAALPLLAVAWFVQGDGPRLGLGLAVFVPVFILLGRVTGIVSQEDLRYALDYVTLRLGRRSS
jgi:O-antigen/teichoic acid export membrane protein